MTDSQIATVRQLSEWLEGTDISLLELSGPDQRVIRLRRGHAGVPAATQPTNPDNHPANNQQTVVRAGSVGVLLHTHPLRSEPLVKPGQEVAAGQPVALLKIGLVLLPVRAPRAGTVNRIIAAHETAVGFGEALIELA